MERCQFRYLCSEGFQVDVSLMFWEAPCTKPLSASPSPSPDGKSLVRLALALQAKTTSELCALQQASWSVATSLLPSLFLTTGLQDYAGARQYL